MKFLQLQRRSLALLDKRSRRIFILAIIVQASLGLLDVVGVLLSGVIGTMAATSYTHLVTPAPVVRLLKILHLSHQDPTSTMIFLSFCALGFFLLKTALALFFTRKTFRFLAFQQSRIASMLLSKILKSDYVWLRKQDPHDVSTAAIAGISAATVNALGQTMLIIAEGALVALFLLLLFIVNLVLALSTLCYIFIVLYSLNAIVGKKVTEFNTNLSRLRVESQVSLFNALKLFREIRILRRVKWFEKDIGETFRQHARYLSDDIWIQQMPKYALEVALLIGASGLLVVGKLTSNSGSIVPILAIYLAGATRIFPSLLRIQGSIFSLRAASYYSGLAHTLLETLNVNSGMSQSEAEEVSTSMEPAPNRKAAKVHPGSVIELRDLTFMYPNSEQKVLKSLSFKITQGERVAIVGPSGSGKSTLCDLLLGLLDPSMGSLQIGDIPAATWIEHNLGKVSYLPQETTLISGTLLQNICLGLDEEQIDFDGVALALRRAQLDAFVKDLPDGLETYLGVSGSNLSGGQKQRIGIARALYSNPNIIIMDEATSALDAETEHEIMTVLESLGNETTVIFIAHRLSSIRDFPRVMYFEDGALLCDGHFAEVRAKVPRFDAQVRLLGVV